MPDTSDFLVSQMFIKENTLLIETSGGSRDQVLVFQYHHGTPSLKLKQVTKEQADIQITSRHMTVTIGGIYAGDAPLKKEGFELETAFDDLKP